MADKVRSRTELLLSYANNATGNISSQNGRDLVMTVFGYRAAGDPTADNDSADTAGIGVKFSVGSVWTNTTSLTRWRCVRDTPTLAVWTAGGPPGPAGDSIFTLHTVAVPFTDVQTGGSTNTVPVLAVPAGHFVLLVVVRITVAFAGVATLGMDCGDVGSQARYGGAFTGTGTVDAFIPTDHLPVRYFYDFVAGDTINLYFDGFGQTLNDLTDGEATAYIVTCALI